ncbi:hypothetical protein [Tunturiibacter gelidoferens]|uniref:Uncharacterized protein n=1 Tax=Tunturiibacter lichenicola TaxID=2051959 RepID=A0A7Y9NRC0_9BACT|nr:hypothetical protein [Edaphobacter lichenicola]NYF53947.1 hypothetical protein [Edaphobacter lichenicola]
MTITNPIDGSALYGPIAVTAGLAVGASILNDNIQQMLQWKDFKVTGVTATGTRLFVWYRT